MKQDRYIPVVPLLVFLLVHVVMYFVLIDIIMPSEKLSIIQATLIGVGLSVLLWWVNFRQIHIVCKTGDAELGREMLVLQYSAWLLPNLLYVTLLYAVSDSAVFFARQMWLLLIIDFLAYELTARHYIKVKCPSNPEEGESV